MKRYNLNLTFLLSNPDYPVREDPNGKWVKWEDIKPILERYSTLDSWDEWPVAEDACYVVADECKKLLKESSTISDET